MSNTINFVHLNVNTTGESSKKAKKALYSGVNFKAE